MLPLTGIGLIHKVQEDTPSDVGAVVWQAGDLLPQPCPLADKLRLVVGYVALHKHGVIVHQHIHAVGNQKLNRPEIAAECAATGQVGVALAV